MSTTAFVIILMTAIGLSSPVRGADASFKHWRNAMKAAEDAKNKREFEKMREILEAEVDEAQKLGPASSAENTFWLAFSYQQLGQLDLALQAFNAEIDRIGTNPTAVKLQVLRGILLGEQASLYNRMDELDKALASANEGKAVLEEVAGKFHPELYDIHMTIGRVHFLRKEYAEAEASMKTALKLAQSGQAGSGTVNNGRNLVTVVFTTLPAPYRIIRAATDLGTLYLLEKKYDEAEPLFKLAVENAHAVYPKDSFMQVLPLRSLAEVEFRKGDRKKFIKDTDEVFRIVSKTPGIGMFYAQPLWLRMEANLSDNDAAATAESARKIAKVYEFQNYDFEEFPKGALKLASADGEVNWKRAELLQQALANVAESYGGKDDAKAGIVYVKIAEFNSARGKPDVADAMFEKAVASQREAKDKALLIGVLGKMAEAKIAAGKKEEALKYYHQVSLAMHEKYGDDMRVADAMDAEAAVMKDIGQEDRARSLRSEATKLRNKIVLK